MATRQILKNTRRQKHRLEENTHTIQRPSCFPALVLLGGGRCGGNWGQHNSWGTQLQFLWRHMGRSCLNTNTHLAQSLCVSLAILTVLPSLVKWWLLREKRRQSTYLDSAFLPTLGVSSQEQLARAPPLLQQPQKTQTPTLSPLKSHRRAKISL